MLQSFLSCVPSCLRLIFRILYDPENFAWFPHKGFLKVSLMEVLHRG